MNIQLTITLVLTSVLPLLCTGQDKKSVNKVSISHFKNNAKGAYTIIHDDFGGNWAQGIENYADTMAYNRGISFCFALITGQCDEEDWQNANRLIRHGHQVVNHSMNHKCGVASDWCTAGNWDEKDFPTEIDSSSLQIKNHTGKHSAFFMFPFDLYTDTMIAYLEHKGFAGARAGTRDVVEDLSNTDPFYLKFMAFLPGYTQFNLDSFVVQAIDSKGWAIREVHGVEDGSWGTIPLKDYQGHLDFIQKKQKENQLWVATLSDVLFYKAMKEKYTLTSTSDSLNRIMRIDFSSKQTKHSEKNSARYSTLQGTAGNKSLTLIIPHKKGTVSKIKQKGKTLSFRKENQQLIVDADPENGSIEISYK